MDHFTGTGLTCVRGDRIIFTGLNFTLNPGEALVLSGPNGSGKTSLLRVMAGLSPPTAGIIKWRGQAVPDDPVPFFNDIHYLGHQNAVKPALSVRENLNFYSALRPSQNDVGEALSTLGLSKFSNLPARLLSAGQTRRVALSRILCSPASIWLLDEPFVSLDQNSAEIVYTEIIKHRTKGGMVVISTNAPLELADFKTINLETFAYTDTTIWGDTI